MLQPVCPMRSAWDLNKLLPSSKLYVIDNAGHSMKEIGIPKKLIDLTNELVIPLLISNLL